MLCWRIKYDDDDDDYLLSVRFHANQSHWQYVFCDGLVHMRPVTAAATSAVVAHTKEVDVDLLQVVNTAELIEFVVNLVVNQRLVVVGRVVTHDVMH